MIKANCLYIALLLLFCSCAKLKVTVSVLNSDYLKNSDIVSVDQQIHEIHKAIAIIAVNLKQDVYLKSLADFKVDAMNLIENSSNIASSDKSNFKTSFDDWSTNYINIVISNYLNAINSYNKANLTENVELQTELYSNAINLIRAGDFLLNEFPSEMENILQAKLGKDEDLSTLKEKVQPEKLLAVSEKTRLTLNSGLLNDPFTSKVIYAPDPEWEGTYNLSRASSFMGNSDFAIIMDGLGSFTIKGVRFDESEMMKASFSALNQSIKLVAASYGLPTKDTETNSTELSSNMNSYEDALTEKEQINYAFEHTKKGIIALILSQQHNLANANDYKTAVETIKSSYEKYKNNLLSEINKE